MPKETGEKAGISGPGLPPRVQPAQGAGPRGPVEDSSSTSRYPVGNLPGQSAQELYGRPWKMAPGVRRKKD